jgi:hypothetical protein
MIDSFRHRSHIECEKLLRRMLVISPTKRCSLEAAMSDVRCVRGRHTVHQKGLDVKHDGRGFPLFSPHLTLMQPANFHLRRTAVAEHWL